MRRSIYQAMLFAVLILLSDSASARVEFPLDEPAPGNLRFTWIHGSLSAKANTDVRVQVHRYNEHTYILRQNPAVHWEAPFMYLLLGRDRALLLDAGATENPAYFPLYDTLKRVLDRWQDANGVSDIELIVLPLGDDLSQTAGLSQFAKRAGVTVLDIGSGRREALATASPSSFDLGGRTVEVFSSPGLSDHAISVFDPYTRILFTGNAFYPGRLVIRDFEAYRGALTRLTEFVDARGVTWIAGGRIEMTSRPGLDYILRTNYRPDERALEMSPELLSDALGIVNLMNGQQGIQIHDDFIVMHGVGRGARAYGWPVYIPEQFDKKNTR